MAKSARKSTQGNPIQEIEAYLAALETRLQDRSPAQRLAFVTALAERRLAQLERSPDAGQHTPILHAALDLAWSQVQGGPVPAAELESLRSRLSPGDQPGTTIHALAGAVLDACLQQGSLPGILRAARLDCEFELAPPPGYPEDLAARQAAWRQPGVAAAVEYQQSLLLHTSHPIMNTYMVDFLKRDARSETPFQFTTTSFTIPTPSPGSPSRPLKLPSIDPGNVDGSLPNSGILQNLASILGKLQQGDFPADILKKAGESGIVTSQAERDHARLLESTMAAWENPRRTLFATLLAGRWLKQYESFSTAEGWGDPGALRRALAAARDHLLGKPLSRSTARRLSEKIIENTPDTEDFDAPLAMAACEILDRTLDCCLEKDNLDSAASAAMAACSSLAMLGQGPGYTGTDQAEEDRLWQQPAVRREIASQRTLLAQVSAPAPLDAEAVKRFYKDVQDR